MVELGKRTRANLVLSELPLRSGRTVGVSNICGVQIWVGALNDRTAVEPRKSKAMTLPITNQYGNVDMTDGKTPIGYRWIRQRSAKTICDRNCIPYARALVDFRGKKKYGFTPVFDGVVVRAEDARLHPALAKIKTREVKERISGEVRVRQKRFLIRLAEKIVLHVPDDEDFLPSGWSSIVAKARKVLDLHLGQHRSLRR